MAEKKPAGRIRKFVDKVRKKVAPTFGEQFDKARKEKKKTFRSTRDNTKKGKLEYSTMRKKEVDKKIGRLKRDYERNTGGKGGGADSGKKPVYEKATGTEVSSRGQAFAKARKEGKKTFMYKGKKYTTMLKGEKKKKLLQMPELSGKTSKKIKRAVRGNTTGFDIQGARKGGLIKGLPKLAKKGF